MAKLDSIITFTGKLGNIIAYNRGGKHFLRSRPDSVRQTAGTRRAAHAFGAASRKCALIRGAIMPDLDICYDGSYVNRLNSAILRSGRNNHAGITGFRFNAATGINKFFHQPPVFSQNGMLRIPAQHLQAHGGAKRLEVKLIATRIDFANRRVTGTDAAHLTIDLEQPFEGAEMPVEVPGKGTLVVTLQIRTYLDNGLSYNRKYMAADIIAVAEARMPEPALTGARPCKRLYHQSQAHRCEAAAIQHGSITRQREFHPSLQAHPCEAVTLQRHRTTIQRE